MLDRLLELLLLLLRDDSFVLVIDVLPREQLLATFVLIETTIILVKQLVFLHEICHFAVCIHYLCHLCAAMNRTAPAKHQLRMRVLPLPEKASHAPRPES